MKRSLHLFAFVATISFSNALADEKSPDGTKPAPEKNTAKITYAEHVVPIFRQHCFNCHHQGDKKGGLALDNYGSLLEGGGSGEVVYDDGDFDSSRLWQLVNHDDTPVMPPNQPKIPADHLTVLRKWIEGGILENSGSKAKEKKKNALAAIATTIGRPEGGSVMPQMTIAQKVPVVTARPGAVTAIAASPWAPLVAVAGQKQIVLYHTDTAELLGVLPFPEGSAQSIRFSVDGAYLVAGGGEHSVRGLAAIYDVETGQRVATVGDEFDTIFDADVNNAMNRVAMGGPQKMLRIFDATDGTLLFDIKKHTDWIYAVAFSPDGVLVASADRSGGLHIWEAETGRLFLDLAGHQGAIRSLSWRDDSNILVSGSEDGTVRLWDIRSGKQAKSLKSGGGAVAAVDVDHAGNLTTAQENKRAKVWDANGKHRRDLHPMSDQVLEIAFSHDGKKVIYGDWTGEIVMVKTDDPKQVQKLASNPPPVASRAESTKKILVSVQQKIAPLAKTLQASTAGLTASKNARNALDAQIQKIRAQAKLFSDQAAAKDAQAIKMVGELKALESKSSDLSDSMIAAKVAAKSDSNRLETQTVAEETYAKHLLAIVNHRRGIAKARTESADLSKQAAETLAGVKPLDEKRAAVDQQVAAAKAAVTAAKKAHDVVAGQLSHLEAKHQHLMSQMN